MSSLDIPPDHRPRSQVNSILRDLRGEDFRRARNLQRSPATIPPSTTAHSQRTLPFDVIFSYQFPGTSDRSHQHRETRIAGPRPPQSWRKQSSPTPTTTTSGEATHGEKGVDKNTPAWREMALSPILCECPTSVPSPHDYPHPVPVPPLIQLCIHIILATCGGEDLADLVPDIPVHLRRAFMRYAAVHMPLSVPELEAVCDGHGSADGDLIVVGPRASLRRDWFQKTTEGERPGETAQGPSVHLTPQECSDDAEGTWDDTLSLDTEPVSPTMLSFVSTLLTVPTFLALPPTITHLALLNIPYQVPLQRLPTICPLLVFLDLSYNDWLSRSSSKGNQILMSMAWHKLHHLQVLGLREFSVAFTLLVEINRGRWQDVRIIT